jgi:hypothetical protein
MIDFRTNHDDDTSWNFEWSKDHVEFKQLSIIKLIRNCCVCKVLFGNDR